jgi:outer membrane beta-barrel protein
VSVVLIRRGIVLLCLAAFAVPSIAVADSPAQVTVQPRFAEKEGRFALHVAGTTVFRDDFYRTVGYGAEISYYMSEDLGFELRGHNLHSWLSPTADVLREESSLVPDLRAPDALFTVGARWSWGYGKVLTLDRFVVHFDPQVIVHTGITLAEGRVVPTITPGVGFLTHWQHGIQVKMDLQWSIQIEQRQRGWIPSFGFIPVLAVGWSPPRDSL